ncbi:MAG: hemerythrin domain-containing protein [Burkholderiales bacterium]
MLIEWSPQHELGVQRMDATHREFVACVNALHDAADDQMLACLDALLAHTVEHFAQEDRWMKELAFPPAHCHVPEHEGILQITREVRGMIVEGKYEIGRVLAKELAPWFENHAATMDNMLAAFIQARGFDPDVPIEAQSLNLSNAIPVAASCSTADCGAHTQQQESATSVHQV